MSSGVVCSVMAAPTVEFCLCGGRAAVPRLNDKLGHGLNHQMICTASKLGVQASSCSGSTGREYCKHGSDAKLRWDFLGQPAALLMQQYSSSQTKAAGKTHRSKHAVICEGPHIDPIDEPTDSRRSSSPNSPKRISIIMKNSDFAPLIPEDLNKRVSLSDSPTASSYASLHLGSLSPQVATKREKTVQEMDIASDLRKAIGDLMGSVNEKFLSLIIDAIYKPILTEPNTFFLDNFGPVPEIGRRVPVQAIEGALPVDFPEGIYIRDGPNPQFGGGYFLKSPFGKSVLHWFEGDGMLHATYFEKGGKVSYQNRYVETEEFKMERRRKKPLFLPFIKGDPKAIRATFLLNVMRFGKPTKGTCNTTVYHHAGKVFSIVEGTGLPYETDMSDNMRTVGSHDFNGAWDRGFTAHPKVDPDTNEMIVTGYSPFKPYLIMGVVAPDGDTMLHKVDVGLDRCTLSHDTAITPRYTIIFDYPLTADAERLLRGEQLLSFDHDTYARIGVMPRFGDVKSMKWFNVEMNCTFHTVNAYEDGDEVVLHGFRSRVSFFPSPPEMDKSEWFGRAITPIGLELCAVVKDPWIDGALLMCFHEWRFNMVTNQMIERDLSDNNNFMEFPTINGSYLGKKYKYAYANVADLDASKEYGMPMFGKQIKIHIPDKNCNESSKQVPTVKIESRDFGPHRYGSEPQFVAKPGSTEEDDGWLVTYVYDRSRNTSEVHIVSTKNFKDSEPLARIALPQRVPFGFHGCFVPGPQY